MNKFILLILTAVTLSGCQKLASIDIAVNDFIGRITYKYYFKYKGEILCSITEENSDGQITTPEDKKIYVSKLQEEQPVVEFEGKISKWSKLMESVYMLNVQYLDVATGSSTVLILDRETGKILITKNLYNAGNLKYVVQKGNCQQ